MDTMLASQRRLLSQVDFSGLILAETVLKKLDTRVLSANLRLMQPVDASSIELARRAVASLVPTTELISDFQFRMDELSRWIDKYLSGALAPLKQLAERAGRSQEVCDAFVHYGLWLAPSMDEPLVGKVVDRYKRGGKLWGSQ